MKHTKVADKSCRQKFNRVYRALATEFQSKPHSQHLVVYAQINCHFQEEKHTIAFAYEFLGISLTDPITSCTVTSK